MRIYFLAVLFGLMGCLLPPGTPAAHAAETVPTNITAERMQYDASGQKVIFSGNVHVVRPDFELWSNNLTAHLEKREAASGSSSARGSMGAGQVDRIVAEGAVRMKSGLRTGTCGKATYTVATGRIVMERSPEIVDTTNNNRISGDSIIFNTRDGQSDVIGSVRASFSTADGAGIGLGNESATAGNSSDTGASR